MFDTSNLHNKIVFLKKGTRVFYSNIEFSTFVYNSALLRDNSFSLTAASAVFCWVFFPVVILCQEGHAAPATVYWQAQSLGVEAGYEWLITVGARA